MLASLNYYNIYISKVSTIKKLGWIFPTIMLAYFSIPNISIHVDFSFSFMGHNMLPYIYENIVSVLSWFTKNIDKWRLS